MTITQQIITIGLCIAGTMLTRFLPFAIFNEKQKTPAFVQYLGKFLPSTVFGMLVVYCLRNVHILSGSHGLPEFISILVTTVLHVWKRQMLLSIAWGNYLLYATAAFCFLILLFSAVVFFPFYRYVLFSQYHTLSGKKLTIILILHRPAFPFFAKIYISFFKIFFMYSIMVS